MYSVSSAQLYIPQCSNTETGENALLYVLNQPLWKFALLYYAKLYFTTRNFTLLSKTWDTCTWKVLFLQKMNTLVNYSNTIVNFHWLTWGTKPHTLGLLGHSAHVPCITQQYMTGGANMMDDHQSRIPNNAWTKCKMIIDKEKHPYGLSSDPASQIIILNAKYANTTIKMMNYQRWLKLFTPPEERGQSDLTWCICQNE